MPWSTIGIALMIAVWKIVSHYSKNSAVDSPAIAPNSAGNVPNAARYPTPRLLPLAARVRLWWQTRTKRSRPCERCEYGLDYHQDSQAVEVNFYGERKILKLTIKPEIAGPIGITGCTHLVGEEWYPLDYGVEYSSRRGAFSIHLSFPKTASARRVRAHFEKDHPPFNYHVDIIVAREGHGDYPLIREGLLLYDQGNLQASRLKLQEYCRLAPGNPSAYLSLAKVYVDLGQPEQAEFYAIMGAAHGLPEQGTGVYRAIQSVIAFADLTAIRKQQKESQDWQPGGHHGVVVVSADQRFRFGMDGWYVKKYHALLEIRREAAARFLTRLDMTFTNRDFLIDSRMRIIHADDRLDVLTPDRFSVGDSPARNVYIQSDVDKLGTWLLPDLNAGDLIEWTYYVAYREKGRIDDLPRVFVLASLSHPYFPTYQASLEFRTPSTWNLKCASINLAANVERIHLEDSDDIWHRVEASRMIPVKQTGYRYEANTYNPIVACAHGVRSWNELGKSLAQQAIGSSESPESLPSPLGDFISESPNARACLERTFYWVRDKIKYGSFDSAAKLIGKSGRLETIVKSRYGDCKDKSFVLAQVAKALGLPFQFILVSAKHGVTIEELPADQFDHIFVRVFVENRWEYLDATDSEGVFGLPGIDYQGQRALLLEDEGGRIIPLPVDGHDRNLIEIVESLDRIGESRLSGTFQLIAHGRNARKLDEHWKLLTLQVPNQTVSGAQALAHFMPRIDLDEVVKNSHTGNSDMLSVSGNHHRCDLNRLSDSLVGTLAWQHPAVPLDSWRVVNASSLLTFPMPLRFTVTCIITGELTARLLDFSDAPSLSNDLCDLSAEVSQENGSVRIHRSLILKTKLPSSEQVSQVAETMVRISQALQVAVKFRC